MEETKSSSLIQIENRKKCNLEGVKKLDSFVVDKTCHFMKYDTPGYV